MCVAYVDERIAALVGALLMSSLLLGRCATSTADSSLMDARAEAPAPRVYLPVEDLPPRPEKPAMTADEMSKLKKDLSAARDRQTSRVKAREGAAPPKPVKP
jgi:lactam utilization protein B